MTLLGATVFQMGVAAPAAAAAASDVTGMNLSLDEIIESRRNQQQTQRPKSVRKTVSNTDRSIATSRAKRNAAMDAKRGLRTSTRPSAMEVEQAVKKQTSKTAVAKARNITRGPNNNATGGGGAKDSNRRPIRANAGTNTGKVTGADKAAARRVRRETFKEGKAAAAILKPPSKKAVTAAVNAMQSAGFSIPQGQQLVISFAPIPGTAAATVKGPNAPTSTSNAQNNNNRGNVGTAGKGNNNSRNNNRNNNRPRPQRNE